MKKFIQILLILFLSGCNSTKREVNPNIEQIRNCAKQGKAAENTTFKRTIAEETTAHKAQQAHYSDIIAHPEKYADVVVDSVISNQPVAEVIPSSSLPDIANPNTPQTFKIDPVTGAKTLVKPECKNGTCPIEK